MIHTDNKIKNEDILRFLHDLEFRYRIVKNIKKKVDKYLAPDFNLVSITNPEENDISRFIALLLNPKGEHGQGDMFLRKFLEVLRQNLPHKLDKFDNLDDLEEATVETEFPTPENRRIDILIRLPNNRFGVGIENKLGGEDQKNQLRDYNSYLKKTFGQDYVLIYLTCDGREPSEDSISESEREELKKEGKLITISYRKLLIPWLQESLKECEADKVRWFVKDFISWIEENCKEVKNEGE